MKKCASFEEQKVTRYIQGNIHFGIILFSCLLSAKVWLRFVLISFVQKIKSFYQSSLGNKVDFMDIWTFPQISWLKIKVSKKWDTVEQIAMIITTLMSSCHWKTLVRFWLQNKKNLNTWKRPVKDQISNTNSELLQNSNKNTNYVIRNNKELTVQWYMCYLCIACFEWKINVFQQRVISVYYILYRFYVIPI